MSIGKAVGALFALIITIIVIASLSTPVFAQQTCTYDGFEATVLQGTDAGLSLQGSLELTADATGALSGMLTTNEGRQLHVAGQITGRLIGLVFDARSTADDPLTFIFGTGVLAGKFSSCTPGIGGTLTGPAPDDLGSWADPCGHRPGVPPRIPCDPNPPTPAPYPIPQIPNPFDL